MSVDTSQHTDQPANDPVQNPAFNLAGCYTAPNPYHHLAEIRAQTPVFYEPAQKLWVVMRHEDVSTVLRDPQRFSSVRTSSRTAYPPEVLQVLAQRKSGFSGRGLVHTDPPDHTRLRNFAHRAFTPRQVARLEGDVRGLVNSLIDRFVGAGEVEFVEQFAAPLPIGVICQLLGVPEEASQNISRWCADVLTFITGFSAPDKMVGYAQSMVEYHAYIDELIAQHRAEPREDFTSALIEAIESGEQQLSEAELVTMISSVVLAGHGTTINALGNCLYRLLSERQLWEELVADPSLIPNAIEEAMRYDGAGFGLLRYTTETVTLSGVEIPPKAIVYAMIGAAAHDEAVFPDPERFDLRRPNAKQHFAFGQGIHYCIGAPLARMEMSIALETLIRRLPTLRLADREDACEFQTHTVRGPRRLHLTW